MMCFFVIAELVPKSQPPDRQLKVCVEVSLLSSISGLSVGVSALTRKHIIITAPATRVRDGMAAATASATEERFLTTCRGSSQNGYGCQHELFVAHSLAPNGAFLWIVNAFLFVIANAISSYAFRSCAAVLNACLKQIAIVGGNSRPWRRGGRRRLRPLQRIEQVL